MCEEHDLNGLGPCLPWLHTAWLGRKAVDGHGNAIPSYFSPVDLYPVSTSTSSFAEDLKHLVKSERLVLTSCWNHFLKLVFCPQLDLTSILFCFCDSDVWWILYSKTWLCADTSISCYCIISFWIYWFCSAQNVPSWSCLHSYLFFSFLPTRFALMPLSAVLPRGGQEVKQEKAVFLYGMSALSFVQRGEVFSWVLSRFCCTTNGGVSSVSALSHQWGIVEVEVLPTLTGPRWESLSGY